MKIRQKICLYPHNCLSTKAKLVTEFDDLLKRKIERMTNIMRHFNGIGIAANQCFMEESIFLAYIEDKIKVFVNPNMTEHSDGMLLNKEGCLSIPGISHHVPRYTMVALKYQDENGEEHTIRADKDAAMVLQHELDHLNGKVYIDYLSKLKQNIVERRMLKLKRKHGLL